MIGIDFLRKESIIEEEESAEPTQRSVEEFLRGLNRNTDDATRNLEDDLVSLRDET